MAWGASEPVDSPTARARSAPARRLQRAISSPSSTATSTTTDSAIPTAPVITSITVGAADDVTVNGTSEADDSISVYDGTVLLGETIANASGVWSFNAGPLSAGEHDITATATDPAGVTSPHSPDPVVTIPAAPVILSASPDSGPSSALTTTSNQLTLVGTAAASATITVFDGSTDLGTATTNASGVWTFTTTSPLADGSHSFTATATNASGAQSTASAALAITVAPGVGNFSALTDQWSNPITVGGLPYYVENANVNGNAPWAITEPNDHTLQFDLQPGDLWPDNGSARTEIAGGTLYAPTSTVNISYQVTVQPGLADTGLSWEIIGQVHSDDSSPITEALTADYPVLSFHMTGADGVGGGDYLAIQVEYALSGQTTPSEATPAGNPNNGYLYVSSQPIVRGEAYSIQVEGSFQNNSNGFVEVWVNGVEVVNYHGPIGYGASNYWKEGVYEGTTQTQPITIDYANTTVTAAPSSPVISTDTVNGNLALLGGTAQANSTVSIYDGSTLLGSTLATSGGTWNYTTSALSVGTQSLTATATDSAGNVSAASLADPTTIAAFTGPIVTAVTSSSVSGEAVVGNTITFSLAMSSAVTVSGAPALTLSDGGTAIYASGSGTNTLNFSYTVSAGDVSTSALAVTGVQLPTGASITDGSGNPAILVGASHTFNNIVIDTTPVSAPVFGSFTANANGSITISGTAAPNTTVHEIQQVYSGGVTLNLDGTATVNASGNWTYTTPSLINGTWNGFTAYDENSLGDVSATATNNGAGISTNMLPSPVIEFDRRQWQRRDVIGRNTYSLWRYRAGRGDRARL